jgi:hypothetical protein
VLDSPVMGSPAAIVGGMGSFLVGGLVSAVRTASTPCGGPRFRLHALRRGERGGDHEALVSDLLLITGVTGSLTIF